MCAISLNSLLSGYFLLTGANYCVNPTLIYITGGLALGEFVIRTCGSICDISFGTCDRQRGPSASSDDLFLWYGAHVCTMTEHLPRTITLVAADASCRESICHSGQQHSARKRKGSVEFESHGFEMK